MSVKQAASQSVHTLLVPTTTFSLLVPSAIIAEVVIVTNLTALPAGPDWCAGLASWRNRTIPIVSLEVLTGSSYVPPGPRSKHVVFFPLPGCHESQFFAIQSLSEPQPNNIADTTGMTEPRPESPLAAAALKLETATGIIPDLNWLKSTLYPSS